MVLLVDENAVPLQWNRGRVVELHLGADNLVRVVFVKTASGVFKRAVLRVCLLPTFPAEGEETSSDC